MSDARPSGAGRRLLARIRGASLTVKLTVLGGAVTALVVLAAFWALNVHTRRNARAVFAEELGRHQGMLLQLQRQHRRQRISSAAILTLSPPLRSALATYRGEVNFSGVARPDLVRTVEQELSKLLDPADGDLLLATNEAGIVFAAAVRDGRPPRVGTDLSVLAAVRQVLAPTTLADSGGFAVLRDGTATYQLVVYPLVLGGYTIGTLALGERIDRGLVAMARAAFEGKMLVTTGDSVLAGDADSALVARLPEALQRVEGMAPSTVELNGEEYVVASLPLGETQSGERVSLWLMQPIERAVRGLTEPLTRRFALYGLLAIAVAALGATAAARSVLRPFRAFVSYLGSGAATDRSQGRFTSSEHSAEVRTLNDSFQGLMDSIDAKQSQLAARTSELTAANAVLRDEICERERMEHALGERDEQLRQSQKLEAVGTLAGGIAHDFNNLLTAMSGFTQLALMRSDPEGEVAADLRQVVEAADRAAQLTKQLLAFSRKQVLRPTVLDVADVIAGIAPLFGRLLGEHIKLQLDLAGQVPRVIADRGQLEQVIMNLAINARDAMPRGGLLTVGVTATTSVVRDRGSSSPPTDPASWVVISVSDSGSGIPEAIRDRIFEPFFTTKDPGKGTGLGLSTVYGIVTQSGGRIDVDSTVGVGTTFRIALPAANETATPLELDEAPRDLPAGHETILLVEDDAAVRGLARRTLEACGYRVVPTGNPLEALQLARTARIDLILSDIQMPHLSGPEMVSRYLAEHPAPVVVLMSGYADDAVMADGQSIRSAFLRKPFTPAELARVIRDALDESARTPVASIT